MSWPNWKTQKRAVLLAGVFNSCWVFSQRKNKHWQRNKSFKSLRRCQPLFRWDKPSTRDSCLWKHAVRSRRHHHTMQNVSFLHRILMLKALTPSFSWRARPAVNWRNNYSGIHVNIQSLQTRTLYSAPGQAASWIHLLGSLSGSYSRVVLSNLQETLWPGSCSEAAVSDGWMCGCDVGPSRWNLRNGHVTLAVPANRVESWGDWTERLFSCGSIQSFLPTAYRSTCWFEFHGFLFEGAILDLLTSLVEANPSCCQSSHAAVLFGAYQATLHSTGIRRAVGYTVLWFGGRTPRHS